MIKFSWYQMKLFFLCLLLGVLPLLALGTVTYLISSKAIQQKVNLGNDMQLQQTKSQIENTLQKVENSIFQLSHSQEIIEVSSKETIDEHDFQIVNKLLQSIQRVQLYKFGIGDIQVINLSGGWVVNNKGYQLLQDFPDNDRVEAYLSLPSSVNWVTEKMLFPSSASSNQVYLVNTYPLFSADPTMIIVTHMSSSELFEYVPGHSDYGTVMIMDRAGNVIMDNSMEEDIEALTENTGYIHEVINLEQDNGYIVTSIDSVEYGLTNRKSDYNGWVYLSIVSIKEITKESRALFMATLWTCLIIFVIISIISLQGAARLYSPVRRLYSRMTQTNDAKEKPSIIDEFTTMEKLYSAMHNNQYQLEGHIQNLNRQLKHFFMFKLVQGTLKTNEIREQIQLFNFAQNKNWIAVMTIQIDTMDHTSYEESDRVLLLFAISNIVEELLTRDDQLAPIVIEQHQVNIIHGVHETEEQFKAFLSQTITVIQEKVKVFLKLAITVGVSRPYQDYSSTPKAYAESLDALKYRITKANESILFIEEVEPEGLMMLFPDSLEKQLVEAVKFVDEERATVLLQEFLGILLNRELTYSQIQNWLMKLLLDLVNIPEQEGITVLAIHGANVIGLYEQLNSLKTVEEIEAWFSTQILKPIIQSMEESKGVQYNKIAEEVIRIIEREFDRDLTLEECASRLNYHPSYIRRVLKKSLNVSFTQYLLQYRMEMAKKWLTETDLKISEISENLRYTNAQNFIRYFKKVTDLTPGQYRDKWHIEKSSRDSSS
jgi:two-component system, response regulator YesN